MSEIRIQKYLADCAVSSRRGAEKLVEAGVVKINNKVAKIGDKINPDTDVVFVDGKLVEKSKEFVYYFLNKPRGYVTTMSDEMGRKCVADLISDIPERVYPVGRLDRDSEGMLLLTNDGDFANKMMHPSRHVNKTYRVTVRPKITDTQLATLSSGMVVDGYKTSPAQVKILTEEEGRVVLQITIHEGRNRQIRKMCESLGLEVARLKRTAIGSVKLGMLKPGELREAEKDEIKLLKNLVSSDKKENTTKKTLPRRR